MSDDVSLYKKCLVNNAEGLEWLQAEIHNPCSALFAALTAMTSTPLVAQTDNFTPSERTPWGGHRIVELYKRHLGVETDAIVGESWEISGHPSFPTIFFLEYEGQKLEVPLTILGKVAPQLLFGEKHSGKMPFLVKLLNSGSWLPYKNMLKTLLLQEISAKNNHKLHRALSANEDENVRKIHTEMLTKNLSVQVHPREGDFPNKPSKTEAWFVLDAEPGAGIYLGLREGVTAAEFEQAMKDNADLSVFLRFIEVSPGEIYFIPAGTLHAIGAGLLLLEPQETSETTFRAYDWGRLQDGKPRDMHKEETIRSTVWESNPSHYRRLPTEHPCCENLARVETLLNEKEFQMYRLSFSTERPEYVGNSSQTGIQGHIILEGIVDIEGKNYRERVQKGQSFIIPAGVGIFALKSTDATIMQIIA